MEMLFYVVLAALLGGIIAEGTDRAVERTLRARRPHPEAYLRLGRDLDARPTPSDDG